MFQYGIRISFVLVACITHLSLFAQSQSIGGKDLYMKYCATCHGKDMKGGMSQSLTDGIWQFGSKDTDISDHIKNGIPTRGMPAFKASISDSQIEKLITFIREQETIQMAGGKVDRDAGESRKYSIKVQTWVENLEKPWAIDFIDNNKALVTECPGRLRIIENGILQQTPVKNTPEVLYKGQGGLLDVAVDPEYNKNGWIYLSYSHILNGEDGLAMTRLVRGKIYDNTWVDRQVIYEAAPNHYSKTRHHYGSRIVFDKKGYLYFSIGERGAGHQAQDITRPNGKIHRIQKDGRIPDDNPFIDKKDAITSIFAYGNRNPQGLAVHPLTDQVWETEHGPMGGDEVNLIQRGKNYGWPEITYGIDYDGSIISEFTEKPGMEQPVLQWTPSIAACGLDFYKGDLFKKWKNDLIAGALKFEEVHILHIENNRILHDDVILKDYGRVRDVTSGPDGAIYVVLNEPDKILRLTPMED